MSAGGPVRADVGTTLTVARWIADVRYDQLPGETVRAVRRSVLDSLGVMAAGRRHPAVQLLLDTFEEVTPSPPDAVHLVVGHDRRVGLGVAATVNATMGHVLDFDDTILPSRAHLSAPLLGGLLAVAERDALTGRELIAAFAVGFEVAARCADAVGGPAHGWHPTAVMGPLGVAAATGRVLGLRPQQFEQALGLAANQSSGLQSSFGSMAKAFNVGRAASAGVTAALLAAGGMTAGGGALDEDGLLARFTAEVDRERFRDLGATWAVERNGFKPYPCGFVSHAAIDAVLEARAERLVPPDDVRAVRLAVSPETVELTGNPEPTSGLEAKFSVHHAAAAAYLDGEVTPWSFSDRRVRNERYRRLAARVEITAEPGYAQGEASVEIRADGGEVRAHVPHALGTPENPMDDHRLSRKFSRLATPVLGPAADRVARVVGRLEDHRVDDLLEALAGN